MIHSYWVDLMLQKALPWEEEICLFFNPLSLSPRTVFEID